MKKSVLKALVVGLILAVGVLPASAAKKEKQRTIIVGTGSIKKNFNYLDEKGNLVGYEIDVVNEIAKLLPQYKIEFQTFTFKDILIALSAGKIDVGAHQYEWNEERAKNYLFSDYQYNNYDKYVVVLNGRKDITRFEDLAGKKVQAGQGSATLTELQKYNDSVPDNKKLKIIVTGSQTKEQTVAAIRSGAYDAIISSHIETDATNAEYGNPYQLVDTAHPFAKNGAYHVFSKKDKKLKADWDAALKQLIDSGKISELSVKWFGVDYLKAPEN